METGRCFLVRRVTDACRALALRKGNVFTWFWVGTHPEYERLFNG
jgi:hypothetical protein